MQFIKRHWISTHSTDAKQKLARKEDNARRKDEFMQQKKDNQQVKVRAYNTCGEDEGYVSDSEVCKFADI